MFCKIEQGIFFPCSLCGAHAALLLISLCAPVQSSRECFSSPARCAGRMRLCCLFPYAPLYIKKTSCTSPEQDIFLHLKSNICYRYAILTRNSSAFGFTVTESAPFRICQGQRGGFCIYFTLLAANCAANSQLQAELLHLLS